MAVVFESLSLRGLRKVHLEQLLSYIYYTKMERCYYGNLKQYEKREEELIAWLEDAVKFANEDSVRFPKKLKGEQ